MKKSRPILHVAVAIILLSGCAVYMPQPVDIPLIKEKGDIRVNAGVFVTPVVDSAGMAGAHVTFSAGLTNVLAIQVFTSIDLLMRAHLQGALGLYKSFENNAVIEIYGGYGYGSSGWFSRELKSDSYHLLFAQFNIGKTGIGKLNFDFGFGLKSGCIFNDYANYNKYYSPKIEGKYGWMIEPSAFFRFGGKRVKYNMAVNYMWTKHVPSRYYFPFNISMGVNLNLGKGK